MGVQPMNERDEYAIKKSLESLDSRVLRDIFKEAWRELLREYVTAFGWFSISTIGLSVIGALIYFVLTMNGWMHK